MVRLATLVAALLLATVPVRAQDVRLRSRELRLQEVEFPALLDELTAPPDSLFPPDALGVGTLPAQEACRRP